jgi:predicted nucleotidyltransferase component of viral defense system
MMPDREALARLAAETGFREQTLEKVIRLGEILADVGRHPLLSTALALKGGTALNLCFGAPARLSVDLDFNYIRSAEREVMLVDRPEVERALVTIAAARDYHVQQSRDEHAGRKIYLGYRTVAGTPDRVEVDLNFLHRLPLIATKRLPVWQPGEVEAPVASVVSKEELWAGKLCALLDRVAPRDLYDTARLPSLADAAWIRQRLRPLLIAMAGTLDHPIHSYGRERLERVTPRIIREQLHPMLQNQDRPDPSELLDAAWRVVGPFVELTERERDYTDRLQRGELRPDLIFPDELELADRLGRHPALLWKAVNCRRQWERG